MCTLVVAFRTIVGRPWIVLANRDERLARAASGPRRWEGEDFVAPRDDVAGGTWVGLNARGLFVGITNRFGVAQDPSRASRGALVVEALRAPSAAELHATLARLASDRFNAFHLLYADRERAFVTWSTGDELQQDELAPGLHVVTERSLGGDDRGRTELVREAWSRFRDGEDPPRHALEEMMRQHRDVPAEGTCVHVPSFGYGTRSSMILLGAEKLADARFFWAEGAPCTHPFEERADLVAALEVR